MITSFEMLLVCLIIIPGFVTYGVVRLFVNRVHEKTWDKAMAALSYSVIDFVLALIVYNLVQNYSLKYLVSSCILRQKESLLKLIVLIDFVIPFIVVLVLVSVITGIIWGFVLGKDIHYRFLQWIGAINKTGRVDVWEDVFKDIRGKWILVTLGDGSRILGWSKYYSDSSKDMQIFLAEASRIDDEGNKTSIPGPGILITPESKIVSVEFLEGKLKQGGKKNE